MEIMSRVRSIKEEEAYQAWARLPDKNNVHAVRKLSQDYGIPVKTIYDWVQRYNWKARWLADVHASAPHVLEEGIAVLVQGWPMATARLMKIIETGEDKDAVNAIKTFIQLSSAEKNDVLAPRIGDRLGHHVSQATIDTVKELTPEQLWDLATKLGADNMDRALKARTSRAVEARNKAL